MVLILGMLILFVPNIVRMYIIILYVKLEELLLCDVCICIDGGGGDSLIKVGMDVRRVQNLGRAKFLNKT